MRVGEGGPLVKRVDGGVINTPAGGEGGVIGRSKVTTVHGRLLMLHLFFSVCLANFPSPPSSMSFSFF